MKVRLVGGVLMTSRAVVGVAVVLLLDGRGQGSLQDGAASGRTCGPGAAGAGGRDRRSVLLLWLLRLLQQASLLLLLLLREECLLLLH